MKTLNLIRSATILLIVFAPTVTRADEPAKLTLAEREALLEKMKAKQLNTHPLTYKNPNPDMRPGLLLGAGLNGADADNATDETLDLAVQWKELEQLTIIKGKMTKEGFAKLADLPKLRRLEVYWGSPQIDPKAFAVLSKLKSLESLALKFYPVSDELLGYLGECPNFKRLAINQADGVTTAGFAKFLASAKNLEVLELENGNFVDDACLKAIGEKKGMKVLLLFDSTKITSKAWSHLAGLTKLERLWVKGLSIDDEGMKALEGMKELTDLNLRETRITDQGMASLAGLTILVNLDLHGTKITDAGMVHVKGMTELHNLYVSGTDVTAKGLSFVPRKDKMSMMAAGRGALSAKQLDELMTMYPETQMFDASGYWTPERIQAAMKELKRTNVPKYN